MNGKDIARSIIREETETLPEPIPLDMDEAGEIWQDADTIERAAWIQKGFAAACVETKYGEASLEQFARERGEALTTVLNQRRVYLRLISLGDTQPEILRGVSNSMISYSHLLAANKLDDEDYAEVLGEALRNGWSKRQVAEEVAVKIGQQGLQEVEEESQTEEEEEYVEVIEDCPNCEGSGRVVSRRRGRGFGSRKRSA